MKLRPHLLATTAIAFSFVLAACSPNETATIETAEPTVAIGTFGIDTTQMDTEVAAGDDFFEYVNGKWLTSFEMPADKSRYGVFDKLRDGAETDVRALVDELAKTDAAPGTNAQKVGDLYSSWMDEATIEARGLEPIQPRLDAIAAISTRDELIPYFGKIEYMAPFSVGILPDPKDTTRYTISIDQAGLGMPDRDYYLNEGESFETYRAAYKTYVTTLLGLLNDPTPEATADKIIALEKQIAQVHWSREDSRDIEKSYNPMDRAGLDALVPNVDWAVVLGEAGLGDVQTLMVGETTAVRDGAKLIDTVPLDTWKAYLTFHLASATAAYLPKAFDVADFEFYSKTLRGVEVQRDRWKRGIGVLDNNIGEGLGELYVARHFPAANKAKMDALVANLRASLKSRLETLEWMDDETRTEALKKLATFEPRIGYPEEWRDYSALTIEPGKLFENVAAAHQFDWNRQLARMDQPVDREEWGMNPQTVNAYYNPLMNQITFPAAILQPPFFDPMADPAVNYGGIGAVIGHEIGHGFDDQGRQFDETGKIRNWWTDETNAKFEQSTDRFAAQYDAFCPLEGACVNGRLTMGENLGDLGGLQMAYTAYKLSLNGEEAPVIDGYTGDQRFFMSWAQVWQAKSRDDALRNQMLTDPHSPPMYRVNGIVRNLDAWYEAFGVTEDNALYLPPEERVRIW